MYAISGATGKTGRVVAETLLAAGKDVTVIGRSEERLKALVRQGAEPFVGNLEDAQSVTIAFSGAVGVYCLIPTGLDASDLRGYQRRIAQSLCAAMHGAGVEYVVFLSSVGAHREGELGPVAGLKEAEERLGALGGLNVLHLRAAYFMENLLMTIPTIRELGVIATPLRADLSMPMIAARDIGAVAAERLLAMDFEGADTQELLGARDITMEEVTRVIGQAIGKEDLDYVQLSYEDAEKAMKEMGISSSAARLFVQLYRGFNDGLIEPEEQRAPENTTPTTIEAFAQGFADIYEARTRSRSTRK